MILDTITPGVSGSQAGRFVAYLNPNKLAYYRPGTGTTTSSGSQTVKQFSWNHLAWVRNSGTLKMYLNGEETHSVAETYNFSLTNLSLGRDAASGGTGQARSYWSDLRLVKGTAVYTSEFTPPTAPLGTISGTVLHLPFTDFRIFDKSQSYLPPQSVSIDRLGISGSVVASSTQQHFSEILYILMVVAITSICRGIFLDMKIIHMKHGYIRLVVIVPMEVLVLNHNKWRYGYQCIKGLSRRAFE